MIKIGATTFKKFLELVKIQGSDAIIKTSGHNMSCYGMTTDMVCLADVECFDLESDEESTLPVAVNELSGYVSSFAKDATLEILNDERVTISSGKKKFIVPKIANLKEPREFKTSYGDVVATISPKEFAGVIKSAQTISKRIVFRCNSADEISFESAGDSNSGYSETLDSSVKNESFIAGEYKSMYPVDYLVDISKAILDFDEAVITYSASAPCFVFAKSTEWNLRFVIAPIIEG